MFIKHMYYLMDNKIISVWDSKCSRIIPIKKQGRYQFFERVSGLSGQVILAAI